MDARYLDAFHRILVDIVYILIRQTLKLRPATSGRPFSLKAETMDTSRTRMSDTRVIGRHKEIHIGVVFQEDPRTQSANSDQPSIE